MTWWQVVLIVVGVGAVSVFGTLAYVAFQFGKGMHR